MGSLSISRLCELAVAREMERHDWDDTPQSTHSLHVLCMCYVMHRNKIG